MHGRDRPTDAATNYNNIECSAGLVVIHRLKCLEECGELRADDGESDGAAVETTITVFWRVYWRVQFRKPRDQAWTGNRFG
jgi:hypothetical protein